MNISKQFAGLLLSLLFIYVMLFFTFKESNIFWYLYTFTLLVGMAIAIIYGKFKDELPTWKYLLFGIGYSTILYGIIRLGYITLTTWNGNIEQNVHTFLETYGPNNIWHYLLLIFVIVVGEELFWRGYVQQQIKKWISPKIAVIITSFLFALSFSFSGFSPGILVALLSGLVWGTLYEWKKSMPLIIVSHEVFILLLFMILPFF
ncbi:CPBP family intramembrane glutamic endopeptidase [Ureibacillus sp. 179-F W5.1 NHS]|uniref:CPBP family intramembrane metalloprotease n=1 Tax=Lysinibacillus halotolerans TaxID=1368476 RepID=A0A3M8H819_9BACI|nr:type II CAAX endopeptidase family protein [Lysinibacillus halotolerans]RNC98429.1 CPBP family intramembrane metalloprotease [Lysinibacillus halotolerans]